MQHFDERYRETAALRDGSGVTLRLVRPDDKELLRRGFDRLSSRSRYRRFLAAKTRLTDAELAYLTEVDGHDHFAIGAVAEGADGREEGVAIARFIRSQSDPRAAEVAVAVVDDWQGKGLGTLLLLRLVAAARERGIERFAGQVLASNQAVRDVLAQLPAGVHAVASGGELAVEVDLPEVHSTAIPSPDDRDTPLRRLLAMVARRLLVVRRAVERLASSPRDEAGEPGRSPPDEEPPDRADAAPR
jgi:GNAT superfamily N-acetyltransferase